MKMRFCAAAILSRRVYATQLVDRGRGAIGQTSGSKQVNLFTHPLSAPAINIFLST